jgi:EamA-like transporter family.
MWITFALISAFLLGFYDIFKKKSVTKNAVLPVLLYSTMVSAIIFTPFVILSNLNPDVLLNGAGFLKNLYVEPISVEGHLLILGKTIMILISWMFSYTAMKNLPITVVGPVNQLRPAISLLLMLVVFQEHLFLNQWIGIFLAIISFYLMNRSGEKEGIRFKSNKWVYMLLASAFIIGFSGIYDKFLLSGKHFAPVTIQAWYTIYQFILMIVFYFVFWRPKRARNPFQWRWTIVIMAVFLSCADCIYLTGLKQEAAVMAIIPLILNGVRLLVSFIHGAIFFREKNIKSKIIPLIMVLAALVFLCI